MSSNASAVRFPRPNTPLVAPLIKGPPLIRAPNRVPISSPPEPVKPLVVRCRRVGREPLLAKERVLGSNARVVETGRNRVGRRYLTVFVLDKHRERPVKNAGLPGAQRRRVLAGCDPAPRRFDA